MNENSVIESSLLDASELHVKKEWYFKDDNGLWNAMVLIREYNKPLRGRSEVLVVDSKNKTVYLAFKPNGSYSIPGGGWEPDENRMQSSIREVQEEARLNVTDVIYSNSYVELDAKPKQWMMEKIKKENWWYGKYIETYVGEYAGKFTGHINEADKDDMIKIGKFYKIKDVYDELSPYHQKAIDDYMMKKESGLLESSLPLPDNGRPIQVGDISFVYKNTYHPIYWVGDEPYRPRVETLVIRNGKDIFLRMYDTCEEGSLYRYRLPGGSLDNDSTKEQQAENETNEEALLSISEIHNTGLSYYHYYEDGKLLKGGDICIKYKGTISDIFIAKYKGKVDKSTIEKHDLDDDMATNGKFYPIIKVCQLLRPEHVEAIMNSGLVDDNVKGSVRLILRGDKKTKIPEAPVSENLETYLTKPKYIGKNILLYHGSPMKIDRIDPISCNSGTRISGFRMSSFWSDNIGVSIAFSLAQILNGTHILARFGVDEDGNAGLMVVGSDQQTVKNALQDKVIYIHKKSMPSKMVGRGHARGLQEFTLDIPVVPDEIDTLTYDDYCDYIHYITTDQYEKQKMLSARKNRYVANSKDNIMEKILYYKKDELKRKTKEFMSYTKESDAILYESVVNSRNDITSKFLEKGDVCANLQNWNPEGYNILYVTGLSGSGKTTLATDMRKEFNCYRIELDYIAQHLCDRSKNNPDRKYKYSKKIAEEAPSFVVDWLSVNYNKYSFDTWKDSMDAITDFTIWMDTTHRGDGNLYIINGAWIPEIFDATYFTNRPIIVKGSSYLKTAFRRVSRDFKDDGSIDKKIEWFIKNLKTVVGKGYRDARHHVDYFSDRLQTKAATVESTNLSLWGNPIPKNVTLYHASPVQGIKYIEPRQTAAYKDLGPVVFCSRYKSFAACFGTYWDDTTMKQGTDPDDLEKASMWIIDKAYDWSKPCSMYILENDGSFRELVGHPHEYISPNKIKVKKEIKFNSYYAMVKAYDIEVFDYATKQKLTVTESAVTESLETMINRPFLPKKVTLYHGSDTELDIISPISLNAGTVLSKPRMSSFWSFDEKICILMALRVILMKEANMDKFITDIENFKCYVCGSLDELKMIETVLNKHPVILYTVSVDRSMIGMGHHPELNEATIDVPIRPHSSRKLYFDDLKSIFELVDDVTYESILNTVMKSKSKKIGRDGYGLFTNILFHSDKKTMEIRKKCKSLRKEPTAESKSYKDPLYRITYDGDGIYNAIKTKVGPSTWKELLADDKVSWLPKPPEYTDNNVSYFTKKGFDKFTKTTMPLFSKYIEDPKLIDMDKVNGISNVVYSDDYQVVVTEAKSVGANTTGMKRSELPDEMFGIPSQRKYELDTEKHVRSAIKLFNWVDPKYEEELATNIIKRMKYFNITDVNVGPTNRFGKYYKGGNKK